MSLTMTRLRPSGTDGGKTNWLEEAPKRRLRLIWVLVLLLTLL